ncbi:hypothetical protein JZ751_029697 [Albula glossodonta]|uniref:Uncharacterized protein n=1 Tax=Albula glossodonta TaxID=121402 RepID=A0A8T2NLF3_9TELE|nr:hypothetical protein JZ751_029660 [Albula glossodonta]KAG9337217.1 hypothetical protein JZ751_029697 [Albula glossodonta]
MAHTVQLEPAPYPCYSGIQACSSPTLYLDSRLFLTKLFQRSGLLLAHAVLACSGLCEEEEVQAACEGGPGGAREQEFHVRTAGCCRHLEASCHVSRRPRRAARSRRQTDWRRTEGRGLHSSHTVFPPPQTDHPKKPLPSQTELLSVFVFRKTGSLEMTKIQLGFLKGEKHVSSAKWREKYLKASLSICYVTLHKYIS